MSMSPMISIVTALWPNEPLHFHAGSAAANTAVINVATASATVNTFFIGDLRDVSRILARPSQGLGIRDWGLVEIRGWWEIRGWRESGDSGAQELGISDIPSVAAACVLQA